MLYHLIRKGKNMICKLGLIALVGMCNLMPVGIRNVETNISYSENMSVLAETTEISPRYSYQTSKSRNTAYGTITTTIQVDANTGYIQSGYVNFPSSGYIFTYSYKISSNKLTCNFTVNIANSSGQVINTLIFPMTSPGPK